MDWWIRAHNLLDRKLAKAKKSNCVTIIHLFGQLFFCVFSFCDKINALLISHLSEQPRIMSICYARTYENFFGRNLFKYYSMFWRNLRYKQEYKYAQMKACSLYNKTHRQRTRLIRSEEPNIHSFCVYNGSYWYKVLWSLLSALWFCFQFRFSSCFAASNGTWCHPAHLFPLLRGCQSQTHAHFDDSLHRDSGFFRTTFVGWIMLRRYDDR